MTAMLVIYFPSATICMKVGQMTLGDTMQSSMSFALFVSGLLLAGAAQAQDLSDEVGVLNCEFKTIVPEEGDFFTRGFRTHPVVGTKVQIDFGSPQLTSMTFEDGSIFFAEGDGVLSALTTFGTRNGFAGVRVGSLGTYVVQLTQPQTDGVSEVYTSRLAVTRTHRAADSFDLVSTGTHYGDLECRAVADVAAP